MAEISQTGDQMLTVLETIAQEGPLSAADVARLSNLNRTVVHRLLSTLSARGYARKDERGYVVGPSVLELSSQLKSTMRMAASEVMQHLAKQTGETVVLHAIDNLEAVVIDQAQGQKHLVRVSHTPGSRHLLCRGASGWSILAFQNNRLIERALEKHDNPDLARELIGLTQSNGYSITHDELQMGVHGVAVPVLNTKGSCQFSLGLLVPNDRASNLEQFVPALKAAAAKISLFEI